MMAATFSRHGLLTDSAPWERVLSPPPWRICIQRARLSMREAILGSKPSSILLLALAILTLLTVPAQTQSKTVVVVRVFQATTVTTTSSNTTSTNGTNTTSSTTQWDLLIPMLLIGMGAGLAVMIAAVIAMKRRHARAGPAVQLICPRCRMPISPYDAACRNCHTPLYHPYRYYQQRR